MLGKLKGIIDTLEEDSLILDVGGAGYHVFASGNTLRHIGHVGEAATLFIETHVREDHIHLFGFATQEEKRAFLLLNKVNGVGAKMALAVLSIMSPSQLATAIAAQDAAAFKAVSGVGPKLAARIIAELKDKFSVIGVESFAGSISTASTGAPSAPANEAGHSVSDAVSALVNLGYNRSDAYSAVMRIAGSDDELAVGELIRLGLKELGKVNV